MLVYKLVSKVFGRYYSAFNYYKSLEYRINETTVPEVGHIYVFRSLDEAIAYLKIWGLDLTLLEGEGTYYKIMSAFAESDMCTKTNIQRLVAGARFDWLDTSGPWDTVATFTPRRVIECR